VDRVHEWFGKLGHWALVVGYFVPGVRHLTAVVAGTSELEFRQFALYAYAGALFWVSVFLTLGYLVGDQWERVYGQIHHQAIHVGVALAVAAAVYLLWKWLKRRRNR
jgi:membrane protein DedA with SNARE-associated domain